ncbi:MAG: hypothetical protein Q7K42_01825, partial [Candidatus Diapherotrites archaeon]|nr:hypothetical protein [Candidatus Diapherotrites archaeon]
VSADRLDVAGFKLDRPVRIYSPGVAHSALFYQSDSGDWWVFDLTSACAGKYESLTAWHATCGATDTDCSKCREHKSDDIGYSTFTATDAGNACSNVLECENNFCANGIQVGQCIPDSPPYKCGLGFSPQADVPLCGCPIDPSVSTDPLGIGCLCNTPLQRIGNTQALCTDEAFDGLINGQKYYYVSYDCAGADHKPLTLGDNIDCGTGFKCVAGKKGTYPFGVCERA